MEQDDCVFCKMSRGEIKVNKIYENDNFFSIHDANPRVAGHSLVISKKHFPTSLDMPSSLDSELMDCIKETALKVMEDTKSTGFNVVNNNFSSSGQEVKHVHFHILPRVEGDGFKIFAE